jgi:UDP-glucose 4-epimerase
LKQPFAPVLLGFDPLMQVIHEKDVIEALVYTILNDVPGVFNIAAEGVLPLSRLVALGAKMPIPVFHLFAYWTVGLIKNTSLFTGRYVPIELDYLRYSLVSDLTKMHDEMGFVPSYTAEEALREFGGEQRMRRYAPDSTTLVFDEERLRDTIERRRRARETNMPTQTDLAGEGNDE